MIYITIKEAAILWGITERRINTLCNEGRIQGAKKLGSIWTIPSNTEKPQDLRKKENTLVKTVEQSEIEISRIWAMPNKNTFDIKPIKDLIMEEKTEGLWIDPFANKNKIANITNDLNTEYDTDYHMDALDFLKMFDDSSVDGVLYDPPYSPRQVSECYNDVGYNVTWDTTKASFWGNHKREISRILKSGGKVITFGWNSGGIGKKYGMAIKKILLVPHGGWHNDTICTVETKIGSGVIEKSEEFKGKSVMKAEKNQESITDNIIIDAIKNLPENYWDFKTSDTQELTHGLHSYPAMMIYPISRNIIKIMKRIMHIDTLLDPFAGSGTVLVEGTLAGVEKIYGNDLNPLSQLLSLVKTKPLDIDVLTEFYEKLTYCIGLEYSRYGNCINSINQYFEDELKLDLTDKNAWGCEAPKYLSEYYELNNIDLFVPDFKNIGYWFKPSVIMELQIIKDIIKKIENIDVQKFFFVAFSETIRLVSNRRNGEFKMFRMTKEKVAVFNPNVRSEYLKILERNISKMQSYTDICDSIETKSEVKMFFGNSNDLKEIPDESIDLVITSPPYGDSRTTVAYGEYSRLSLQWLDLYDLSDKDILSIDKKLMGGTKYRNGFEYTLTSDTLKAALEEIKDADIERAGDVFSFYKDMDSVLMEVAKKTKTNGYQFWVVGNRTVKNVNLKTDVIIRELAEKYGMRYVYTIDREISNKVMPSKNSPSNKVGDKVTTMVNEHIVVLRKIN